MEQRLLFNESGPVTAGGVETGRVGEGQHGLGGPERPLARQLLQLLRPLLAERPGRTAPLREPSLPPAAWCES